MVIGRDFVWGHLPRAGGDATSVLFGRLPDLVLYCDDPASNEKHVRFSRAPLDIAGKQRVLNMRRLPSWMLSYIQKTCTDGLYPEFKPLPLPSRSEILDPSSEYRFKGAPKTLALMPDELLGIYEPHSVDVWLKMEQLREDFLQFVSTKRSLTDHEVYLVKVWETKAPLPYDHDVSKFFSNDDVRTLYRNNPVWAEMERQVYGALP
jgi:hypothetical protein